MRPSRPQSVNAEFVRNALLRRVAGLPRAAQLVLGLALVAAIAVLDYVTGPRILLNVFYLLPVMLVARCSE